MPASHALCAPEAQGDLYVPEAQGGLPPGSSHVLCVRVPAPAVPYVHTYGNPGVDTPNDKLPAVVHGAGPKPGPVTVSVEVSWQPEP